MAKLKNGYTWWPKDWRSNMEIASLSLQEKGFYRELIDETFIQMSAKIKLNERVFCRLHGINSRTFRKLLQNLSENDLIVIENLSETIITIPSVSKRLGNIEQSYKGGNNHEKKINIDKKQEAKQKQKHKQKHKQKVDDEKSDILIPSEKAIISVIDKFYEEQKQNPTEWLNALHRTLKIKPGQGAFEYLLEKLKLNCISDNKQHPNTNEVQKHFKSLAVFLSNNTSELEVFKTTKSKGI